MACLVHGDVLDATNGATESIRKTIDLFLTFTLLHLHPFFVGHGAGQDVPEPLFRFVVILVRVPDRAVFITAVVFALTSPAGVSVLVKVLLIALDPLAVLVEFVAV